MENLDESFLHFLWKHKLIQPEKLETIQGQKLEVASVGLHNQHHGPDFLDAKIRINDTLWYGPVEFHWNSSDWYKHGHEKDSNYNNVILHIVYEQDKKAPEIPTIELKGRISKQLIDKYQTLLHEKAQIPCHDHLPEVPKLTVSSCISRMATERLENKTHRVFDLLEKNKNDWSETAYQMLLQSFGFGYNKSCMLELSEALPYSVLRKYSQNIKALEALLMGCAGFLSQSIQDEYYKSLQKEFRHLRLKHKLNSLEINNWKFASLRPVNFPTVRLAQFAAFLHNSTFEVLDWIEKFDAKKFVENLQLDTTPYWNEHYHFAKLSKSKRRKKIGKNSLEGLIINAMVPMIFAYGMYRNQDELKEKALNVLEELKSENNHIIEKWNKLGVKSKSAFDSQALIQLKNEYCNYKKCLNCPIGTSILR